MKRFTYKPADAKIDRMQANGHLIPLESDEPVEKLELLVKVGMVVREDNKDYLEANAAKEQEEAKSAKEEANRLEAEAKAAREKAAKEQLEAEEAIDLILESAKEEDVPPPPKRKRRK